MAGPVLVLDVGIVLRALVDVLDEKSDRRAGRHLPAGPLVREHAGQDLHRIRLAPLRGEAGLARAAAVEIGLDIGCLERDHGRATVDHAAERRPVALAEGRDPEQMAEGVVRHGRVLGAKQCGVTASCEAEGADPRIAGHLAKQARLS
jgi:hypothetical protein